MAAEREREAEAGYEAVLCVKQEVNVYRIPPRASNRGYRAADWKLDQPDWTGRLRVTSKGDVAYIKLEDKVSGELFAQAPVETYPGITVESVSDSSRYFVLRIQDGSGRSAFIGVGFSDRGDAFDFNVTLQDHFKWVKQDAELSKQEQNLDTGPKLDLGFKEGQTIELHIGNVKKRDRSRPRASGGTGGLVPLLPPPGGKVATPDPSASGSPTRVAPTPPAQRDDNTDVTPAASSSSLGSQEAEGSSLVSQEAESSSGLWGEFTSVTNSETAEASQKSDWVQF